MTLVNKLMNMVLVLSFFFFLKNHRLQTTHTENNKPTSMSHVDKYILEIGLLEIKV